MLLKTGESPLIKLQIAHALLFVSLFCENHWRREGKEKKYDRRNKREKKTSGRKMREIHVEGKTRSIEEVRGEGTKGE